MIQDPTFAAILGAILAIAGTIVGTIVGVILGYFFSEKGRGKGRLIDGVYRPLLGQIGLLSEKIESSEKPDLNGLEEVRQDGMYFAMDEKITEMASQVYEETKDFIDKLEASQGIADKIVEETLKKTFAKHPIALKHFQSRNYEVKYKAFIGSRYMGSIRLRDCLPLGETPVQFLIKKRPSLKESNISTFITDYRFKKSQVDTIWKLALKKAEKVPIIQELRGQKQLLIKDLLELKKMLKKRVI